MALQETLKETEKKTSQAESETSKKNSPIRDLTKFTLTSIRENKKWALASYGSMVFLGSLQGLYPMVYGSLITSLQKAITTGAPLLSLLVPLISYRIFNTASMHIDIWSHNISGWFYQKLGNHMYERNLGKGLKIPPLVQKQKTEKKISSLIGNLSSFATNISRTIESSAVSFTAWAISTAVLIKTNPYVALGIIGYTGLKTYTLWKKENLLESDRKVLQEQNINLSAERRDLMSNARNIRIQEKYDIVQEQIHNGFEESFNKGKSLLIKSEKYNMIHRTMDFFVNLGFSLFAAGSCLETGDIGTFTMVIGSCFASLNGGSQFLHKIIDAKIKYQEYEANLKQLEYDRSLDLRTGEKELHNIRGNVCFKDVCFSYPSQTENGHTLRMFENFNLQIHSGERVCLIGPSGMGKSTLVSLLAHEYEIQSGCIEIDGQNVQEIKPSSLARAIHYLDQEPSFFTEKDIEYNLRFFKPNATEEEIKTALTKAHLYDDLMAKEDKLHGKTTALSPGQQQRLSIACAFLKDSPILILDEPTSKLDVESQKSVLEALREFSSSKTLIFVSHIPAEIATATRCLVLDKGRIIEDGTPSELIRNRESVFWKRYSEYKNLFRSKKKRRNQSYRMALKGKMGNQNSL